MLMCKHFQLFWLFVSSMLFALLILLTTYPTTNLFFSLPISAFTNGFWLYFHGYIKCFDSSSTLSARLALWFLVTLSMYTSRPLNLGKTHLRHAPIVWGHKGCNLLALIFIWVDILNILIFSLSFSVESGHLSSLASLSIVARARPTLYKMTTFMVRDKRWIDIFWWLRFPTVTLELSMLARNYLQIILIHI